MCKGTRALSKSCGHTRLLTHTPCSTFTKSSFCPLIHTLPIAEIESTTCNSCLKSLQTAQKLELQLEKNEKLAKSNEILTKTNENLIKCNGFLESIKNNYKATIVSLKASNEGLSEDVKGLKNDKEKLGENLRGAMGVADGLMERVKETGKRVRECTKAIEKYKGDMRECKKVLKTMEGLIDELRDVNRSYEVAEELVVMKRLESGMKPAFDPRLVKTIIPPVLLSRADKKARQEKLHNLASLGAVGYTSAINDGITELKKHLKSQPWVPYMIEHMKKFEETVKKGDEDEKQESFMVLNTKATRLRWDDEEMVETVGKAMVEKAERAVLVLIERFMATQI